MMDANFQQFLSINNLIFWLIFILQSIWVRIVCITCTQERMRLRLYLPFFGSLGVFLLFLFLFLFDYCPNSCDYNFMKKKMFVYYCCDLSAPYFNWYAMVPMTKIQKIRLHTVCTVFHWYQTHTSNSYLSVYSILFDYLNFNFVNFLKRLELQFVFSSLARNMSSSAAHSMCSYMRMKREHAARNVLILACTILPPYHANDYILFNGYARASNNGQNALL